MRTSRSELKKLVLALVLGALAMTMAVEPAHGRLGTRADFLFAAAASTFADPAETAAIDLKDGRSDVPAQWRPAFEAFARNDRSRPPAPGGVVFVGSSSIAFWHDLDAQFPSRNVLQRGLGGATMADCTRHADRLILPYRPRVVVIYAGDNDLALGVAPARIVSDYAELVAAVHRDLPAARLVFVSIKPSPSRVALLPRIRQTNALMAAYARTDGRLDYVDVFTPMLDHDQHVRPELFRPDGLHMVAGGYALWHDAIVTHLD